MRGQPGSSLRSVKRSWTVIDFVLIWVGGFVGSALGLAVARTLDVSVIVPATVGQFAGNLVVFWLLARRKDDAGIGWAVKPKDTWFLLLGFGLQFVVALLMSPLARYFFPDGRPPQDISNTIGDPDLATGLRVFLIVAAVAVAPLIEEILFRGVLLKSLRPRGKMFAIVTTAVIFAAVHLAGLRSDRFLAAAAVAIPPLLFLGVLLAWITIRTGRLGPAILIHSGWNLLAVLVLLIPTELLEELAS